MTGLQAQIEAVTGVCTPLFHVMDVHELPLEIQHLVHEIHLLELIATSSWERGQRCAQIASESEESKHQRRLTFEALPFSSVGVC